jgi:DNA replication protein DnaC
MPYKMESALYVIGRIGESMVPDFRIDSNLEKIYVQLIKWFHGDPGFKGDLTKGFMLMGPTGSGKTLAMNIFLRYREIDNILFGIDGKYHKLLFRIADVNEIIRSYVQNAYDGISIYGSRLALCIDDLGYENEMNKSYGNPEDVIPFIIGERYSKRLLTFATTNRTIKSLEDGYDSRTFSRMHEMFNFIIMDLDDFRKTNSIIL